MEHMEEDIRIFLKNHINAVRTCHYPDQIPWYYLCDENGIYMMSETNLESHGSWQKMDKIALLECARQPSPVEGGGDGPGKK